MKFRVRLLRRVGRRLAWREVLNGAHHVGELVTHAVLPGFSPLAFRAGFERVQDAGEGCAVVQEWHCEAP
jgi:hypothetical protein